MNFEEAKAMRIAAWRSTLDDHEFRMSNPEAYRLSLHRCSARLAEEGLIDSLDQYDMDEMANAAYWLEIEERDAHPVWRNPASNYDVIPVSGGPKIATIMNAVFRLEANKGDRIRPYDGLIRRSEQGLKLEGRYGSFGGRIDGLVLTVEDGSQFDLVETERRVNGVIYPAIEDPEVYRWMSDVVQVALENRHLDLMRQVRPFFELAKFVRCDVCEDNFCLREECENCDGWGFVPKTIEHQRELSMKG
ncbi:hypothetical protein ACLEJQ_22515 [Pseudomonas sp. SMV71]|uniref:hypothetical protein n=1 Tax=unclassified Pseudomonas TaxID=196821 RepID=UPI003F84060F